MKRVIFAMFSFATLASACSDPASPTSAASLNSELRYGKSAPTADPTATVKLPLSDTALSVKSDRQFSDGTYSMYANGVCGISATLFLGGSGDMVMDGSIPNAADRKCASYPRKVSVIYPDGTVDVAAGGLISVSQLENSSFSIPIGTSTLRHMHVRTSSTRCDGVHWGGPVGGDSVVVSRVSANTWHVTTQPYPNDQAACKKSTGNTLLGHMTVDLWIVSSRNVP